jgi:hypothetical protein
MLRGMRRTARGWVWTLSLWSTLASLGCSGADPDVEVQIVLRSAPELEGLAALAAQVKLNQ